MSTSKFAAPKAGTRSGSNTRTLLGALALSSPLWTVVSLAQAATREGFDLTRHPLSMLSVGSLGWLQITNFIVAGVLAILGAVGLKQAIPSRWAPRLVITYGIGYILSGVFVMQPGDGFPTGTPLGQSGPLAWHTVVHLFVGIIAFIALTAVLFVLGRYFARRGERGWAWGGPRRRHRSDRRERVVLGTGSRTVRSAGGWSHRGHAVSVAHRREAATRRLTSGQEPGRTNEPDGRVSSLDFFVSLALMPVSMAVAGPADAAFGVAAVFLVAGIVPVLLAVLAILVPRLDREELAHPLDHPTAKP